jgi:hypothetical protein
MIESRNGTRLREADWVILPPESQETLEMTLALCTGAFFFGQEHEEGPYLVAHSGPTQFGNVPQRVMHEVMNRPEFNGCILGDRKISLMTILDLYRRQLRSDEMIGVYMVSGARVGVTDLALARYFLLAPDFSVLGAELNRETIASISVQEAKIRLLHPLTRSELQGSPFEIGKSYPFNLRPT